MNPVIGAIRKALRMCGVEVTRPETLTALVFAQREMERIKNFHGFLSTLTPDTVTLALKLFPFSRGENFQDIFTMLVLQDRQHGFFVEFGATDGVQGSNTYLMEKAFGWVGILAEPARCWHDAVRRNRSAAFSSRCVWREGGIRMTFRETQDAGFSTLDVLSTKDRHASRRRVADIYEVDTITLLQLLDEHNAPKVIEYLSIDTEGSEFDILENFDFELHRPLVMTIEHNYRPDRDKIIALLAAHNYLRAPQEISKYDDWFICKSLTDRLHGVFTQVTLQNVL